MTTPTDAAARSLWCELHEMDCWDLQPEEIKQSYRRAFDMALAEWTLAKARGAKDAV